jgi:hypothetical protein
VAWLVAVVAVAWAVLTTASAGAPIATADVATAPISTGTGASASIAASLGRAGRSLACGRDGDAPLGAFTGAFGGHAFIVGERNMHEPTICCGHGVENHGASGRDRALSHTVGEDADLLLTAVAVAFNVNDDGAGVVFASAKDDVGHVLERTQGFPAASDDQARIFALDVDDGRVIGAGA